MKQQNRKMKFGAIKYTVLSVLWGIMMSSNADQNKFLLIADPQILAIPIIDNHERMIDLKINMKLLTVLRLKFRITPIIQN